MTDATKTAKTPPSTKITKAEAIEWVNRQWWHGLDARTVALAQLRQELLCMPFGDFHDAVEAAAGCSVWDVEFSDPKKLIAMIESEGNDQ